MYDNEYFVVDMASCTSTGEIINSLSLALETLNHTGKKIVLKLNDSYLNQSQMLSIQSLITSYGCILDTVETLNDDTAHIAENMNIYVQKPIEKRVEDKYELEKKGDFEQFSLEKQDNSIALKEVNGLHFEADLDAIQKQQDSIDIAAEFKNEIGISPRSDFEEIDKHISAQYNLPSENLAPVEEFPTFEQSVEKPVEIQEFNPIPSIEPIVEPVVESAIENTFENKFQPAVENEEFENAEKNTIGVYKKAYDEEQLQGDQWEEVDFYETPTSDPIVSDTKNTTYINQTLRSGQVLEAEGNVVIIGDCHPGSEIRALGDITVWGVLSGIAHAGYRGNLNAKVRALKMNAVQLRIGNCYSRRPDSTNIPYIIRSSIFTPEEARVVDGEIMLFKINQN